MLGAGCVDLRTGNCYTEYNISRNGLAVCGGDITAVDNNNALSRGKYINMYSGTRTVLYIGVYIYIKETAVYNFNLT